MEATIDRHGVMRIKPNSEEEMYALHHWYKNNLTEAIDLRSTYVFIDYKHKEDGDVSIYLGKEAFERYNNK